MHRLEMMLCDDIKQGGYAIRWHEMISQSDVRVKYTNDRVRRSSRHDTRPETDHAVRWHEMIS